MAAVALTWGLAGAASPIPCSPGQAPPVEQIVPAIFGSGAADCDPNGDGRISAADLPALALAVASGGTATPTGTPTESGTPTSTPTPTATPLATATGTPRACPSATADLMVDIDDRSGAASVNVVLSGQALGGSCAGGAGETSYHQSCSGSGSFSCGPIAGLAPGPWRHSIEVTSPDTGQKQYRRSLLLAAADPSRLAFTVFPTVITVQKRANTGDGTLRKALQDAAGAAKPLLIQFAPAAFPSGSPIAIELAFALPTIDSDEVTIDGFDEDGLPGNRIIDAGGAMLGNPALSITGARNHIVGMQLRNAGSGDRDVLSITGAAADGNVVEHCIVQNATSADGIGIDGGAGKGFDDTVNIVRDCDISGAADKGVKVTTGAYARIEGSWIHDNQNGGIQSTLGGHVQAADNLIERNRGSTAQNGLSVSPADDTSSGAFSDLESAGNIVRFNGANGISVRASSLASVEDSYFAVNASSGIRIANDGGDGATAVVEGSTSVCNGVDGAIITNTSVGDFGGGPLGSAGNNAFTQNNVGGDNFRNATGLQMSAINNQWEHCGTGTSCNTDAILAHDLSDHGAFTTVVPAQAHRSLQPPILDRVEPTRGEQGGLLRIFGSGFNAIDGHFSETDCANVTLRNRCVPLRGNCVRIDGAPADVVAVTPTMLVVRWPFTCTAPVELQVTTDQGPTGVTSAPITVCTPQ